MSNDRDILYVYFHINKTGGTTFSNHLLSCFGDSPLTIPMLNPFQMELAKSENRTYWPDDTLENKLKAKIILGHCANPHNIKELIPFRDVRYITYFREPSARIVSRFNYSRSVGMVNPQKTFDQDFKARGFLQTQLSFFMYFFLGWTEENILASYKKDQGKDLMKIALEEIGQFFFIGLHHSYKEDTLQLTNHLGIPPVTKSHNISGQDHPKAVSLTPEISAAFYERFPIEYDFFEAIKTIRKQRGSPFATAAYLPRGAQVG